MQFRQTTRIIATFLASSLIAMAASAGSSGPSEADELAKKLSNPTAANASLSNNIEYTSFDGNIFEAGDQSVWVYSLQPSIPFPQANGYNLLFRPFIPVILNQPFIDSDLGEWDSLGVELGNIGYDLAYGTTTESGFLYLFGVVGGIPTRTHDALGTDRWTLGPELAVGILRKWGVLGALATHSWDIAGGDEDTSVETNLTTIQYFYAFGLGNGWQLASGPVLKWDHEADDDNQWTIPLGLGIAKTTAFGKLPVKLQAQVFKYVERPDSFGSDWGVKFSITPVVSVPWSK